MLTYLFCLVRAARRPAVHEVAERIARAGELRVLPAGDGLWAVVASVPARHYNEAAVARLLQDLDAVGRVALAHEAIVEHFLTARAVLPMQLFTLFTSDERAIAHVARDRRRIDGILARIERQLEWGLRLTFDQRALRADGERAPSAPSGTAYLARKKALLDVSRVHLASASREATRLYRTMAREATDARRGAIPDPSSTGSRVLLDAAFLVPARRTAAFRAALRRSTRQLDARGLVVSLTGPWPPYNFVGRTAGTRAERGRSARRTA